MLAVWPSLPRYVVPQNWHEVSLGHLLEDAILQYEAINQQTFTVETPAGLFSDSISSALWRASLYLRNEQVWTAADVYGVQAYESRLELTAEGFVPLKLNSHQSLRSQQKEDYLDKLGSASTTHILQLLHLILKSWSEKQLRSFYVVHRDQRNPKMHEAVEIIRNKLEK